MVLGSVTQPPHRPLEPLGLSGGQVCVDVGCRRCERNGCPSVGEFASAFGQLSEQDSSVGRVWGSFDDAEPFCFVEESGGGTRRRTGGAGDVGGAESSTGSAGEPEHEVLDCVAEVGHRDVVVDRSRHCGVGLAEKAVELPTLVVVDVAHRLDATPSGMYRCGNNCVRGV